MNVSPIPTTRIDKDHPKDQIIRDLTLAIQTRRMTKISDEHDMKVIQALEDPSWVEAMQEELLQFQLQKVWTLVNQPNGYTQEEGIDYDEVFAPVARIEAIRLFLAHASYTGFIVYQMDVKSVFLYGTIEEEKEDGILISQDKYVAKILKKFNFATVKTASTSIETNKALVKDEEAEAVDVHLYRSMIGSLMYLTASRPDIIFVVCACARFQVTPKTSHIHAVKRIFRYFKGQPKLGLWYPRDSPFDLEAFSDNDYAGASLDRKSTTGHETVIKEWEDRMERATTTTSSLEAEQDNAQTRFEAASKQSNDPPLSRVNTLRSGEDNIKLKKLMELCIKLSERILDNKNKKSELLDDAEGTYCLPTATIFAELERMSAKTTSWNEFSSTMASTIICLATNKNFNFSKYIFDKMVKNLEGGVKFLMYPRFVQVLLDKQVKGMSRHKEIYVIPSYTKKVFANMNRPGKGFSGKKKSRRKQKKDSSPTEPIPDKATNEEHVATPSCDPSQSGEDRMQLTELMDLSSRVESSNDVSLGAQDDASKQGRKIVDLDADAEVTLVDGTQEMNDENLMFDTVSTADPVTTAGEVVTTASATTTVDELTLAQTLIEIKAARPKAKRIVFHDQEEQASAFTSAFTPIVSSSQFPQVKDKGKGKMVEPEVPLKKKDQIALDEKPALRLHAEEQAELEKERVAQEEASKAAIIEELDSIQAMINADEQLAARLQDKEQE
ncbi:uncharacterized mitochondrial protein-like protein [Tanacetum coccineum]